jgi:uncharacterized protein (DUF433 family)
MTTERLARITIDDAQCGGRPCIRGMRIGVIDILELLSAGATFEEILQDYAGLEREDVLASIEYAARQTDHARE